MVNYEIGNQTLIVARRTRDRCWFDDFLFLNLSLFDTNHFCSVWIKHIKQMFVLCI